MMKMWRNAILTLIISVFSLNAQAEHTTGDSTVIVGNTKISKLESQPTDMLDKVVVDGDTVDIILPEKNYSRYDRGLFNYLFIPKKQWSFGLTASYGNLEGSDIQILNVLSDLDLKCTIFSLKPYISYFIANNSCVGMKLGYSKTNVDLGALSMDFGDDLNFSIGDVLFYNESYSASIFYRHYIGLGRDKRFGIFNEVDLAFGSGTGQFKRNYNGETRDTQTISTECRLNFSPGLCVFFHDYVSFNVSFGIFGLYYKHEKQKTNDIDEGSRSSSGADFKFNLFNINFGIAVHI
ncbi:MAG: hypothetical protein PHR45_04930 [Muribaculaceae bacterium]|nr:hypothetical protein [Muribaculaceae bacterium]